MFIACICVEPFGSFLFQHRSYSTYRLIFDANLLKKRSCIIGIEIYSWCIFIPALWYVVPSYGCYFYRPVRSIDNKKGQDIFPNLHGFCVDTILRYCKRILAGKTKRIQEQEPIIGTLVTKSKNETHACRPIIFLSLFILSVAVLGTISLYQYRELEQLRYVSRLETRHQSQRTDLLQQEWYQVKTKFEHQIEEEIARRIDEQWTRSHLVHPRLVSEGGAFSEFGNSQAIAAECSPAVCLIQGAYLFLDPKTEMPLRYTTESTLPGEDAISVEVPKQSDASYAVSVNGRGGLLLVEYTGTGFLVDGQGYLITNKHVTTPWEVSREYQPILRAGYIPRLYLFQVFFPNQNRPLQAEIIDHSDTEDVALLYANVSGLDIQPLLCQEDPDRLQVGETVLVLGYPTGFDVLLARLSEQDLADIFGREDLSFDQMACQLARRNLIQPVATRGMCGRVSGGKIIYDAQTAIGGSGAPVFGSDGKVVAINTALLKGFPGTNFGIPIEEGLKLLYRQNLSRGQTVPAGETNRADRM